MIHAVYLRPFLICEILYIACRVSEIALVSIESTLGPMGSAMSRRFSERYACLIWAFAQRH